MRNSRPYINPLNAELNPICHLLALLEAHHIFHVSGIRVKGHSITGYEGPEVEFYSFFKLGARWGVWVVSATPQPL